MTRAERPANLASRRLYRYDPAHFSSGAAADGHCSSPGCHGVAIRTLVTVWSDAVRRYALCAKHADRYARRHAPTTPKPTAGLTAAETETLEAEVRSVRAAVRRGLSARYADLRSALERYFEAGTIGPRSSHEGEWDAFYHDLSPDERAFFRRPFGREAAPMPIDTWLADNAANFPHGATEDDAIGIVVEILRAFRALGRVRNNSASPEEVWKLAVVDATSAEEADYLASCLTGTVAESVAALAATIGPAWHEGVKSA